ncbi:unnamed protein product [Closterium sp. NIES-54]
MAKDCHTDFQTNPSLEHQARGTGNGVGAVGAGVPAGTGAATGGTGAVPVGTRGPARPRPYFVPLLEQILGLPPSLGPAPPLECPQPVQSQSPLQPVSPLPAPSPYAGPTGGLAERLPGTHQMTLRPSTAPLRVPLPSPPASSLPVLADPASDSLRATSPIVARLLSTVVTDPSFQSTAASALVAELVDFAAHCRLDYAASLVAESASVCPPSVGDPDEPNIPTPRSYAEAIEGPYSSQWQSAMDVEMASWKSTGTYVDEVPPLGTNKVSGMWIFRVKRPPGSPPVFKARYVARGFSQRQGVDYFQTFSPTPKMTTLRVLLHVAAQRDYELHSLDFSTAVLQGSLREEIWLRRPPGFFGSFPPGTQWSLRRPVYGLRQAPREWHDTLRTTLAALGFAPSTADPSLFLRTDTSLPPFYVLVLEHRTKHIALRYFLARELQQRGQLRLAYVASEANTADIFTKALPPGDHQRFCTMLGFLCVPTCFLVQSFLILSHTLRVLLHVAAQRDYELHSFDFSNAFLQGSLHEEIWLRRPSGFTGSFPPGTQWSLRRPVYGLRQAPREWHYTLRTTLAALGFAPPTADPSLFLRTDTLLPPFYILVYVDDLVFAAADTARLTHVKSELQKRHTCTDLGELRSYLGLHITRDRARRTITLTQSHMVQQVLQRFDFTYSSPQATPLSTRHSLSALTLDESVEPSGPYPELVGCLISSCEAEIYAGAMAAQELRWLTYFLTDLGEPPRSPPVLYIDNKAMLALCREHRLEHRTKHIALRYFLARELQ